MQQTSICCRRFAASTPATNRLSAFLPYNKQISLRTRSISKLTAINQALRNSETKPQKPKKPTSPSQKARFSKKDLDLISPKSRLQAENPLAWERLSRRQRNQLSGKPESRFNRQGSLSHRYSLESQNLPTSGPPAPLSKEERREASQRQANRKLLRREAWRKNEIKQAVEEGRPPLKRPFDEVNYSNNEPSDLHRLPRQLPHQPWQKYEKRPAQAKQLERHPFQSPSRNKSTPLSQSTTTSYVYDAEPINLSSAASTFIFGHRLVSAALQSKRRKVYRVCVVRPVSPDKLNHFRNLTEPSSVPLTEVGSDYVENIVNNINTNFHMGDPFVADGVLAEVSPLPQPPLHALGQHSQAEGTFSITLAHQSEEDEAINGTSSVATYNDSDWRAPFLLWLHGVVDVRNVGAIFRTALFMGVDGIILSARETASLTSGVLKSSTGATEWLPAYQAPLDLDSFITASQENGWKFFGAVAPFARIGSNGSAAPPSEFGLSALKPARGTLPTQEMAGSPARDHPCVLVLGNEDEGLEARLVRKFDEKITIPGSIAGMKAGVDSLNVGTAAALLIDRFLTKSLPDDKADSGRSAASTEVWS